MGNATWYVKYTGTQVPHLSCTSQCVYHLYIMLCWGLFRCFKFTYSSHHMASKCHTQTTVFIYRHYYRCHLNAF